MEGTDVTHCIVDLRGLQSRSGRFGEGKPPPLQGIERRFLGHPARNVIIILTSFLDFHITPRGTRLLHSVASWQNRRIPRDPA